MKPIKAICISHKGNYDNLRDSYLFRMALDERICHIPFIQTGSSVIVRNENKEILLQKRSDNAKWSLPGGCQDLGEDLILLDNISGELRKRMYPNGDVVYNKSSLYLVDVNTNNIELKKDEDYSRDAVMDAFGDEYVRCPNYISEIYYMKKVDGETGGEYCIYVLLILLPDFDKMNNYMAID